MKPARTIAVVLTFGWLVGCYDAGPYGYDTHYAPLRTEESFFERGVEAVFNDVRTDPEDFSGQLISWFGVVQAVDESSNPAVIRMEFRTHQERHLCASEERESCRVTVSQASSGSFSARVSLRPEDRQGRNRVAPGSLLRVYCTVTGEFDAEGGPLLDCEHYRHWPRGQWAHTGMRDRMRR